MSDDMAKAVREALLTESKAEVACMLHLPAATVIHSSDSPCPLCQLIPDLVTRRLAKAPAPIQEVAELIEAARPIIAPLRSRTGITTLGYSVEQLTRFGRAEAALEAWLEGQNPIIAARKMLRLLDDRQREKLFEDYCVCGRYLYDNGKRFVCHCENDL